MSIDYDEPDCSEDSGYDEDHIVMTCRECGETVHFGDVFHGRGGCVFCGPKDKEDERERAEKIARLRSDAEQKVAEFEKVFYAKHPELL